MGQVVWALGENTQKEISESADKTLEEVILCAKIYLDGRRP